MKILRVLPEFIIFIGSMFLIEYVNEIKVLAGFLLFFFWFAFVFWISSSKLQIADTLNNKPELLNNMKFWKNQARFQTNRIGLRMLIITIYLFFIIIFIQYNNGSDSYITSLFQLPNKIGYTMMLKFLVIIGIPIGALILSGIFAFKEPKSDIELKNWFKKAKLYYTPKRIIDGYRWNQSSSTRWD